MCLTSTRRFAKRAKENIVCYKILLKDDEDNYFAPYRDNIVDINKPYKAKGISLSLLNWNEKGKGYIHTLSCIPDKSWLSEWDNPVVFRCIIPKGTKYHKGNYNDYCSKKIIFKEKIPSYIIYND